MISTQKINFVAFHVDLERKVLEEAQNVAKAVNEVKSGKIDFKVDKYGIVHASVAKASFDATKIADNAKELVAALMRLKPSSAKGSYVRSIVLSSTMSPGVKVEPKSISI